MNIYQNLEINDTIFNAFVDNHESGSLLQKLEWAKVKAPFWRMRKIALHKNKKLIGTAMLLFRNIPKIKKSLCYIPKGFVMDYTDEEDIKAMVNFAIEIAKEENAFTIKIDPEIARENNEHLIPIFEKLGFKHNGFTKGHHDAQIRYTMVTPLDQSEKELFKSFNPKVQNMIRKSLKSGLICKERPRSDLVEFDKLMKITGSRDGFEIRELDYFEKIFDAFEKNEDCFLYFTTLVPNSFIEANLKEKERIYKEREKINKTLQRNISEEKRKNFIIELETLEKTEKRCDQLIEEMQQLIKEGKKEIVLSGAILVFAGKKAYYLYAASSNEYRNFYPNYLMQWIMMQKSQEKNALTYDFGAVSGYTTKEELEKDPMAGLYHFKKQFGSFQFERIGEFNYVINPFWNKTFHFLLKMNHQKAKITNYIKQKINKRK